MEKQLLKKTLRKLVGHLIIESDKERRDLELLYKSLTEAALPDDTQILIQSDFSIGKADLFFDETIPERHLETINKLSAKKAKREENDSFRMFVREVPVRDPLLHGSVPAWAEGAKVSHSLGPFTHKDGRRFWYDFYSLSKFIALYIQGVENPVLLCSIRPLRRGSTFIGLRKEYTLNRGSVWINSKYLAFHAPDGDYTGLAITGGQLHLTTDPVDRDGHLTVSANTTISVTLDLDHPIPEKGEEESPHGVDARNMKLVLPERFSFHFSGRGRTIDEVSDTRWHLYGQEMEFSWNDQEQTSYDPFLRRILIPFTASEKEFRVERIESRFNTLAGAANVVRSAWALPVATIDITQTTEASGTGEMMVQTGEGLSDTWQKMEGGGINLASPVFLVRPGQIFMGDMTGGNPHASQSLDLWQDGLNEFGTRVELSFPSPALFFYVSNSGGAELFMTFTNADFQVDRPVKVDGEPPVVRSVYSLLVVGVTATDQLIYLFDDNLIQDAAQSTNNDLFPEPMALALTNALFKVSPVNGCLLFGSLSHDFAKVETGFLFLTFGLYAYLPTLPDPYAANLGVLRSQIRGRDTVDAVAGTTGIGIATPVTAWLVSRTHWLSSTDEKGPDDVEVSFHFAPLNNQFGGVSLAGEDKESPDNKTDSTVFSEENILREPELAKLLDGDSMSRLNSDISNAIAVHNINNVSGNDQASLQPTATTRSTAVGGQPQKPLPDYEKQWDKVTGRFRRNLFALLDVSTKADLYGVSFNLPTERGQLITTHVPVSNRANTFPVQIKGMDVVSQGRNVKAFTVPQISWEPLVNLTPPQVVGDPPAGYNYYPNDGGPMQILNNSEDTVALAPLPLTEYLLDNFDQKTDGFSAFSFVTLPFGLKALAVLQNQYSYTDDKGITETRAGTEVLLNAEKFEEELKGGLQLQLNAGEAFISGESDMFVGSTLQLNNVLDLTGTSHGDSTLGRTVTEIFNDEFLLKPFNLVRQRGVPLTRIDLSGYGASSFSNWLNPTAAFAETSQAKFDIFVGRCAHEIIQVKSIIYPWAIKVVRTITIFRVGSGYVYRFDSGWRAESDGEFDFRYFVNETPDKKVENESPFSIHPGIIKGLFNVQNIIETEEIATSEGQMKSTHFVDEDGLYKPNPPGNTLAFKLQPVYFDADIEVENVLSGFSSKKIHGSKKKIVPSKKIVGYVQSAPRGIPITKETLRNLVLVQMGSIGGSIDCEVDLAGSDQKMRLNRFDFNNSFAANGSDIVFAVAGRGNVLLPRDGSWSMVKHERDSGEVSPVPTNLSVPVIRQGMLIKKNAGQILDTPVEKVLLRIANPTELLRSPADDTVNYGFLQSTNTQKALFLTPAFEIGEKILFSKTPPLFVDTFRIVNSKSIFPNIGNAENNLGEVISLISNGNEFKKGGMQDLGKDVWKLMDITGTIDNAKEQGYKFLKEVATFDLPDKEFELIDVGDGNFRIYIEYKQKDKNNVETKGDLDFDIDSLAGDVADTWKSRMGNIGLVIDLAGIDRLMTIRGNWDSKKGSEATYPKPDIKFAKELQPVIDILEILQQLQTGDYASAVAGGLKLAMSNKAGSWEYKFEASKEIPVLRFPPTDVLYNDPNTPFKLEAGLSLGAYFNAALKVTTDANELLPSAGGSLGFYGRLSVMCVTLSAATVYAIGQVDLTIAADTRVGPSLRMKFGFGAQLVIGLPVAGNVSVLFVVGIEIYAATGALDITAFMLFEGHAEILGGIVSITIRIEAKGTISKKEIDGGPETRTDLASQVTFGLDISIFLVINISFETSWSEQRQIS